MSDVFWLAVGVCVGFLAGIALVLAFPCVWLVGRSLVRRAAEIIGL